VQAVSRVVSFVLLGSPCVCVTRVQGSVLLKLTFRAVTMKRSVSWYRMVSAPSATGTSEQNPVRMFYIFFRWNNSLFFTMDRP
jgi:hypothetical protein